MKSTRVATLPRDEGPDEGQEREGHDVKEEMWWIDPQMKFEFLAQCPNLRCAETLDVVYRVRLTGTHQLGCRPEGDEAATERPERMDQRAVELCDIAHGERNAGKGDDRQPDRQGALVGGAEGYR